MRIMGTFAKVVVWGIAGFAAGVACASALVVSMRVAGQLLELAGLK